jgi:hypothetical protein
MGNLAALEGANSALAAMRRQLEEAQALAAARLSPEDVSELRDRLDSSEVGACRRHLLTGTNHAVFTGAVTDGLESI